MFWNRKKKETPAQGDVSHRIPPGQHLTKKWPVLHVGRPPSFHPQTWSFGTMGLVEQPLELSWEAFGELPFEEDTSDFHCVTTWSKLDMTWYGVKAQEIIARTRPHANVRYVIAHCDGGYTTNMPYEAFNDSDVMLATACNGETLTLDHGFPMRLVVPKRYAWKSAKWLRALEFSEVDKPGFWEVRGYHNNGEFWSEERYG